MYLNILDARTQLSELIVNAIDPQIEAIKKKKLSDALRFWYELKQLYEALDEVRKALGAKIEALNRNTLPEMFDEEDVKSMKVELDGGLTIRFTKSQRTSCSMPDKEGGMQWLRENGHEGLIQETVNASTLSAFASSYIVDTGKDLPPELFRFSTMNLISATKS